MLRSSVSHMPREQAFEDNPTSVIGPFEPGGLLNKRYRIAKPLGEGGFGRIYEACDLQVHEKTVVVKVLSDSASQDEWVRNKFLKESEALARIHHPGVVEVLDQGATPEGKPFIVMQFVDGVTLSSAIEKGPLDLARAASLLSQAAEALTAVHERGVCHRDLKPENIMLRKLPGGREQAVLIDFGIAGVRDSNVTGSVPSKVAGTLPYMAPEQILGDPQTASDIYSLGVITYKMVTGRTPFSANSTVELYFQQQRGVQQKPSLLRPELPAAAEKAILKAMAFDAKDRYARAMDFSEAFSKALSDPRTEAETQATTRRTPPEDSPHRSPEMAHVLFMDVVGFTRLPIDQQINRITRLQEVVRNTPTFGAATGQDLISLPSGDGMALVFFKNPFLPVECAIEVGRALGLHPEIRLRMGVSQGPVYRVADINENRNVTGGGINMAQRVMDCGDAGHILGSGSVADTLRQLSNWSASLRDLGECEVKHGVRVRLYNIYKDGIGNPARPKKCPRPRWPWYTGIAALVAVLAVGIWLRSFKLAPPPPQPRTVAAALAPEPARPSPFAQSSPALSYDDQLTQAGELAGKGQNAEAQTLLNSAIQANPDRWEACNAVAKVELYSLNLPDKAFEHYRAALARGGTATFRVSHERGLGWLTVSHGSASFKADEGAQGFDVAPVTEAKRNKSGFMKGGKGHHAFHIRLNNGLNYNFEPGSEEPGKETDLILSAIGV